MCFRAVENRDPPPGESSYALAGSRSNGADSNRFFFLFAASSNHPPPYQQGVINNNSNNNGTAAAVVSSVAVEEVEAETVVGANANGEELHPNSVIANLIAGCEEVEEAMGDFECLLLPTHGDVSANSSSVESASDGQNEEEAVGNSNEPNHYENESYMDIAQDVVDFIDNLPPPIAQASAITAATLANTTYTTNLIPIASTFNNSYYSPNLQPLQEGIDVEIFLQFPNLIPQDEDDDMSLR